MLFVNLVRRDDKFYAAMRIGKMVQLFLIVRPGAAGYDDRRAIDKCIDNGQGTELLRDILHPVKPRVAAHRYLRLQTQGAQQVFGQVVLHKKMGKTAQHPPVKTAPPAKKWLPRPENARYQQQRYIVLP